MVWPVFAIALAGWFAAPAGALAYGFRRPVRKTRLPEIFLIASIVKDYRKRSSFWFITVHGLVRVLKDTTGSNWNRKLLDQIGMTPFEIRQIRGLYMGLEPELGGFFATACCVEIVRNLKARRDLEFISKPVLR